MPISNIVYPILIKVRENKDMVDVWIEPVRYMFTKPKTIWPALILAASRKDRVIGRTIILIDSIITRAGFNHEGAPLGSRLAINVVGDSIKDEKIRLNHIGRPNESVRRRCDENLKK